MNRAEESRRFPRLSTGAEYRAHLEMNSYKRIQAMVQNLSACGCGLQIEMTDMNDVEAGSIIDALFLDHPDLPYLPLEAKVVRVLGKVPGKSEGYALVGLDFHTITPFIRDLINAHILPQIQQT